MLESCWTLAYYPPISPHLTMEPKDQKVQAFRSNPVSLSWPVALELRLRNYADREDASEAFVGKPGRAGGGGGGPTPEEKLQVLLYRVALAVTAVCWTLVYTLDFFMTSGISIIDGSVQAAALVLADVSAAVALLAAPTGSRLVAGLAFRLLGFSTLLLVALGMTKGLGAVPGPLCVVLICAREIFWFGWFYKVDAIWGALCFALVLAWRLALANESTSEVLAPELPVFESWEDMPKVPTLFDVRPVGPPVPLSFACWISLSVTALSGIDHIPVACFGSKISEISLRAVPCLVRLRETMLALEVSAGTTTFSPEGRLYQVEYAMEAINLAGSTVGVLAEDGVILAGEKKTTSKLLDQAKQHEKLFQLDDAMFCAVAGITSDANILINRLRLTAQQHAYSFSEPMPVEQLVTSICDYKQGYTQFGGLRPFGVSFLVAGYDVHHGFQLYHTDPSGNFSGWKAYAIGVNNNTAMQIMRQDWKPGMKLQEALELTAKVLVKTMDTASPTAERLEFGIVYKTPEGHVKFRMRIPKAALLAKNDAAAAD
eukprot:s2932_g8.t1